MLPRRLPDAKQTDAHDPTRIVLSRSEHGPDSPATPEDEQHAASEADAAPLARCELRPALGPTWTAARAERETPMAR